uniref:Uncharacterized protein n=1 Tax=Kryptolebias marmoratus TaxID=37003 RepID=A0A3Q3BA40_KRYMA
STRSNDRRMPEFRKREYLMSNQKLSSPRFPSVWAFMRSSEWWDVTVPAFTDSQWVHNFRMSRETFHYLCNTMHPALHLEDTPFRMSVPLQKRVAIALWKLATGSEYRSIAHLFGVSVTTVCKCVQDFCSAAVSLLVPEQMRFPDERKFREMAELFENKWGFPNCVGAIDGSHIPIIAPHEYHTDYYNRKGWHPVILQGAVDGKGQFWNIFAGLPGSLHDARVLRLSTLWELVGQGRLLPAEKQIIGAADIGVYILGDAAYPLQDWLMKPFSDTGRLEAEKQTFNCKLSRAHVVVENAFGRLKGRWRCLLKRNDCDVNLVKLMVLTCCALHNLCEGHGETYETTWNADTVATAAPQPELVQQSKQELNHQLFLRHVDIQGPEKVAVFCPSFQYR